MTAGVTTVTGRAMGTSLTVTVVGSACTAAELALSVDRWERRWSRFLPHSDLSRLNALAGAPVVVEPELFVLVEHLLAAQAATGGRFDPTLGSHMAAWGYDAPFTSGLDDARPASAPAPAPPTHVDLVRATRTVLAPLGVRLDPGGLGKGLAADLVASEAMAAGALGVLVELGGDVVVRGLGPDGGPWRVEIPGTAAGREAAAVELTDGAVVTSDTTVRRWRRGERTVGHVLDPATGAPLDRGLRCTVVAGSGWWAEAVATASLVSAARADGWIDEALAGGSVAALWLDDVDSGVEIRSWGVVAAATLPAG